MKIMLEGYKCERCDHTWIPRETTEGEPLVCPKCKSPYWNKPRRVDANDKSIQAQYNMNRKRGKMK